MIPQATGIRKASTFTGQSIKMSIEVNAMAHIMGVLTNLYSDPEEAVLREYSCNARDSHLAIGSTAPIQIKLPTQFDRYLVIQDFGLGLSIDDITEIYSRYGASTKRDTDDQTGMLGLGSKSALTYATQFTMTSVKDGVKAEVLISVNTEGVGVMEVMDTCATTEPNGVRITIPTRPDNDFASKAKRLFKFWPEGSVLIDGKAPERTEGRMLTDEIMLTPSSGYYDRDSYVVMGGVAYPMPSKWDRKIREVIVSENVVAYVPMGAVDFVPSREQMNLTPRTEAYLDTLADSALKAVLAKAQEDLAAATGKPEALEIAENLRKHTRVEHVLGTPFTYNGEQIPDRFESSTRFRVWNANSWGKRKTAHVRVIQPDTALSAKAIMVTDYTVDATPSAQIRARIEKWAEDNGMDKPTIMLFCVKDDFLGDWSNMTRVDYATIKKVKVPRAAVASLAGTKVRQEDWDVLDSNGRLEETDGHKITNEVLYYSPVIIKDGNYNVDRMTVRKGLFELFPNHTIIEAGKNRHDRIVREFPTAIEVTKAIRDHIEKTEADLSDRTLALADWTDNWGHGVDFEKIIKAGNIDDLDLRQEMLDHEAARADCDKVRSLRSRWSNRLEGVSGYYNSKATDYELALNKYPLLKVSGIDAHPADVVQYLNVKNLSEGK